eukprot:gnl/TRDRNA2_/TRDRNA2_44068_c0_seq1.p1 gnl/TRDRNA2_/TRDRNA2_44068_c0~~gnl/TRDRNA2_/TRDRNA2_44068_c0_seq1.p1  ORF type:complete len:347 (-),score=67.75 gnl/TRDRNA2_/TRDRNA2_44068_c0_seq1:102-1007(-)
MLAEAAPLCCDAVALLRECFARASDLGRSSVVLCGATPFFHQTRYRRGAASVVGGSASAADANGPMQPSSPADYWSCGYRNVQMLIGHLLQSNCKAAEGKLFGGLVPSISSLQSELERLWACGYDTEGAAQLGGRVSGTKKWIGTSEACILLRGQSVRCNIVAFRGSSDVSAADAVVERAWRHFSSHAVPQRGAVCSSAQPPLYLQHDGHSRTIVGVQKRYEAGGKRSDFLLVLDPGLGQGGFEDFKAAAARGRGWERFVKRSLAPLQRKTEYELLVVETEGAIGTSSQDLKDARRVACRV